MKAPTCTAKHKIKNYTGINQDPCQSLGIEPVTDVQQDRAASVLSACQELEKVA